jgi:3-deoxy-7-phosphoheptulonate synthase
MILDIQLRATDADIERVAEPVELGSNSHLTKDEIRTVITVDGTLIGDRQIVVMVGPCTVKDRTQIREMAHTAKEAGVKVLCGGIFLPRTSAYPFPGLDREGLEMLVEMRDEFSLAIVTEVVTPGDVPLVAQYADILQIGSHNMQNYALLHAVGGSDKPILLKRGTMSTLQELLMAAEYILSHGNDRVMLCEQGIRTFETYTCNTFDINAIPALKGLTHLPVIADPSHGTGKRDLVGAIARAAIVAGADGLIFAVAPHPALACSDGAQALELKTLGRLMCELRAVAQAVGREI